MQEVWLVQLHGGAYTHWMSSSLGSRPVAELSLSTQVFAQSTWLDLPACCVSNVEHNPKLDQLNCISMYIATCLKGHCEVCVACCNNMDYYCM